MKPAPALARGLGAMALACLLAACSTLAEPNTAGPAPAAVAVWASSADAARRLERQADIPLRAAVAAPTGELRIDPTRQDQTIVGFGAAMTDASALLIQNVLTPAERQQLNADLFGADGLALTLLRVPIGASDFSPSHYSLDDVAAGTSDPSLAAFSMSKPLEAQIPALQAARKVNPDLVLMASPWSAPGWMKDSGSLIKGQLKVHNYDAFARYFVRYLDAMERMQLPVRYVTVQNEPAFEPADYPGMRFAAADRARFVAQHLGPALAARHAPVGILEWDHNWDKPEEPLAVLADPQARAHVSGVAWHCYAGNPAVMERVHQAWPDKDVFFSECSGGDWAPDWGGSLEWMTDNLVIAPTRAGSKGTVLWNLALDENHGPHLGGCGNCRGVVTIDSRTRTVTRNVEYYVLGHVSRFVRPGARRIASEGGPDGLTHAAFRNPDGSLVLLAHNASKAILRLTVAAGVQRFATDIPAGEVMTFVWKEQAQRP